MEVTPQSLLTRIEHVVRHICLGMVEGHQPWIELDAEISRIPGERARYSVQEGLTLLEGALGALAPRLGEQGRGPVPLAVNQARTALGGAIALLVLEGTPLEASALEVTTQLRLAAGHLYRAHAGGAAVGSG